MKQIRRHVTYANVMSSFAVFLILGGATAFAAVQKIGANEIKANSIKTGKIVKEAVTAGKIKKNAVTESRIADGAVTTNKLADNAVTTPKIANDAVTGDKVKESTLSEVPSAAKANFATNAETAAPRAYARVLNNAGGLGVDEARSKGVTDASLTFVGGSAYCFERVHPDEHSIHGRLDRWWRQHVCAGNVGAVWCVSRRDRCICPHDEQCRCRHRKHQLLRPVRGLRS